MCVGDKKIPYRTHTGALARTQRIFKVPRYYWRDVTRQRSRGPHWPGASKAAPTSRQWRRSSRRTGRDREGIHTTRAARLPSSAVLLCCAGRGGVSGEECRARGALCDEEDGGARGRSSFRRLASYCGECQRVTATVLRRARRQERRDTRLLRGETPLSRLQAAAVHFGRTDGRTHARHARTHVRARARAGAHAESTQARERERERETHTE